MRRRHPQHLSQAICDTIAYTGIQILRIVCMNHFNLSSANVWPEYKQPHIPNLMEVACDLSWHVEFMNAVSFQLCSSARNFNSFHGYII